MIIIYIIALLTFVGVGSILKDIIYPTPTLYEVLYKKKPKRYNWNRPEYGGVILEDEK